MTDSVAQGREDLRKKAQTILRGAGADSRELLALAQVLKKLNEFGYARRLLRRAREKSVHDQALQLKLCQEHALCTYKDPDLPAYDKLTRALDILREEEDLKTTEEQETLGLAGAIYKRMWEVDTDKAHLERALSYYDRGFLLGPEKDCGYTGINAAYVLDLLAHIEERYAEEVGTQSPTAPQRRVRARQIREELIEVLPGLEETPELVWLKSVWWFPVTIAEAYFGLSRYDEARKWLSKAKAVFGNTPLWEFESSAVQLASLAQLQPGASQDIAEYEESEAWKVLEEFLEGKAEAVRTIFSGKFGLGLSGGGFRASFFHIGVLAKLAELDLLRHVHVLSCVSGGSIVGAYYYLELRKLLEEKVDIADGKQDEREAISREDYIELVQRIGVNFLKGVQRNIRTRVAANFFRNLKMAFSPTYSRTERAGELYEKELYGRIDDGGGDKRYMSDLLIHPKGETHFNPRTGNWIRRNKIPMLVLNATTLNTGHNWQFTATWMGESPFAVDPEIDGNWRYRRMYFQEAPERYRKIRLGTAVGASACVPGLFEPIAMPGLYPKDDSGFPDMTVRLVDGGVHDNQGVTSLLEQNCTAILVSDASGQMTSVAEPKGGVFGPLLRTNTTLMERVRQSQFSDLKARYRASLLKGLVVLHLKKGLEVDPVSWQRCKEPPDEPLRRRGELLEYGVLRRIQKSLASVRTDLDSFSDTEAHALMASGYLMTEKYAEGLQGFQQFQGDRAQWDFLALEGPMRGDSPLEEQQDHFERLLDVSAQKTFKIWRLSRPLTITSYVLGAGALVGFVWAWRTFPEFTFFRLDMDMLGWTLVWSAVGLLLGETAVKVLQYKDTLRKVIKDFALAVAGFVGSQIHLTIFDPWFLRVGKVSRITRKQGDNVD